MVLPSPQNVMILLVQQYTAADEKDWLPLSKHMQLMVREDWAHHIAKAAVCYKNPDSNQDPSTYYF